MPRPKKRPAAPRYKLGTVYLIGLGGTGSILVEPLNRLLLNHKCGTWDLVLIDGDRYEPKNADRQMFAEAFVGQNKAEATCNRLDYFPNLSYVDTYINQGNIDLVLPLNEQELTVIITAVDNTATRALIIKYLMRRTESFLLINPGNTTEDSMVHTWGRVGGEYLGTNPLDLMLELKYPQDRIPTEGCQEEATYTPQLISANAWAAMLALGVMNSVLDGKPVKPLVYASFYEQTLTTPSVGDPISFLLTD